MFDLMNLVKWDLISMIQKKIMQCQSKEKDSILEKEVRDVVSIIESLDFQLSTQHVKDSACSMCLDIFLGVNLEVSTSRAVVNCYASDHMLGVTVIIHILMT